MCVGAVYTLMTRASCEVTRRQLGLGPASRVLAVSTEGDTDPEGFFDSIWA